jgi:lysophospholipase L1-like esterase
VEFALGLRPASSSVRAFRFEPMTTSLLEDAGRYTHHPRRFYALAAPYLGPADHPGRYALGPAAFRGRPIAPAPPSILRVGIFGDSCVYGAALDAADLLAQQLADRLEAQGLDPTQVLVASFGVPGYSTVQIRALLEEVLERERLDVVVLYPAAWNDQAPALRKNDLALRAEAERPRSWLERTNLGALFLRRPESAPRFEHAELLRAWRAGAPLLGTRVPAEAVEGEVRAALALARGAGAHIVCVAPAQPAATRRDHPRLLADAESVRRAARAAGVPLLDAAELFRASGLPDGALFCDFVHPSPDGMRILAEALLPELAPPLAEELRRRGSAPRADLRLEELDPESASCFGGERLSLRFSGAATAGELPLVIVGGAPLLDLVREPATAPGELRLRGTAILNRPGPCGVLVQTTSGCAWFPSAFSTTGPELVYLPPPEHRLRFRSRAGDLAHVQVAARRLDAPQWSERGPHLLDDERRVPYAPVLEAGLDGTIEIALPALEPELPRPLYVQALVLARTRDGREIATRWTEPIAVP